MEKNQNFINPNNIIFIKTNENTLKGIPVPTKITETSSNKLMIKPPKTPSYRKSMWSEIEDQLLIAAVQRYGTHNWGLVAASVAGRTRKQCRERWSGKLNPELAKEPWTSNEDEKLKELHNKLGNKWALISVHLPGRSPIMLKNRWGYILRHESQSNKTVAKNNIAQALPLAMPIIQNGNNNQEISQKNDKDNLSNNDQITKNNQNLQNQSQNEPQTLIPPFYPQSIGKDNSHLMPQQISNHLPFSLNSQTTIPPSQH